MSDYLEIARQVMRDRPPKQGSDPEPLESALKGFAVELWSDALGQRFWLVADEEDARLVQERRGNIYTAAEARLVIAINDPAAVAECHRWKAMFDGILRSRDQ